MNSPGPFGDFQSQLAQSAGRFSSSLVSPLPSTPSLHGCSSCPRDAHGNYTCLLLLGKSTVERPEHFHQTGHCRSAGVLKGGGRPQFLTVRLNLKILFCERDDVIFGASIVHLSCSIR